MRSSSSALRSASSAMLQPMVPVFPVEIMEYIFQELPLGALPPVLCVNSHFNAIALRILYRFIPELPVRRSIDCLKSLCAVPANAALVHRLTIDWTHQRVIGNLFRLLNRTLCHLSALRTLSVELSPHDNHLSLAWVFAGCRFQLRCFTTSVRCDAALARFLETQPRISELCLRGFQTTSPFVLTPEALPELTSFRAVHAGVPVLSQVLRGRPVEGVSLSLFQEDGFSPLDTLMLSSRPIKRLTIMSLDSTPPNVLLPEVALRIPELEALHVVVLMAQYTHRVLQDSSPLLSRFSGLRYLTFMAGVSSSHDDEQEIAAMWHKACPTLKTIILPKGKVWFERDGKWTCCG